MQNRPYYWLWAVMLCWGCGTYVKPELVHPGGPIPMSGSHKPLQIQFNGVTSFVIRYGDAVVLTDPFVSNPSFGKVMFGKIYPDTVAIASHFAQTDLNDTKLVVISHAHYDHLMDLPPLLPKLPQQTILAGSSTMAHIIAAAKPLQQLMPLNTLAGTDSTLGQWIYSTDSSVRMMPFVSSHPPHILGITLYPGPYTQNLEQIPVKGKNWKQGLPLSFIIDFMEEGKPVYRIFSQSSSAHGRKGLFPKTMLQEKAIDVVLVSQAVKGRETDYSALVMSHCEAPIVFCTHWENFFRARHKPLKTVPKAKVVSNMQYLQRIKAPNTVLVLPKPGSKFVIGQ